MADASPPRFGRAAAAETVGDWLIGTLGAVALGGPEVAGYRSGRMTQGWRLGLRVAGRQILLDLLIDARFPMSKPEVHWVDAPPFPSIPHVEGDGRICVMPSSISANPLAPVAIVKTILAGAEDILGKGLRGENADDFRTEFRSYWDVVATGRSVTSVVDPCEPSRMVRAWIGKKSIVMAENSRALRDWLKNAHGKQHVADVSLHRVPLIWLPQPLLPSEYPACEADVARIVASAGPEAVALYEQAVSDEAETSLILFGADSGEGAICFGAVALSRRQPRFGRAERRVRGFRDRVPQKLLRLSRSQDSVVLSPVDRADPWWVHGRDTQSALETLLGASVMLIGCGSLGSPIARLLAQAGVGRLILVDPQTMNHANAGRHALGIDAVDRGKAAALRARLIREFPHLRIESHSATWQAVHAATPKLFGVCDLLVSTIGEWESECELNLLRLTSPAFPPILFSWAEPHAGGGHAVLTGKASGCLACGLTPFGGARFQAAVFDDASLRREPACGAFFQPYGAGDIAAIATLGAKLVIDSLYDRAAAGEHRAMAMRAEDLATLGGRLSDAWIEAGGIAAGGSQIVRRWGARQDCPYCGGGGA